MEELGIQLPELWAGIIGGIVVGASALANILPNPKDAKNGFVKFISRVVNYLAVNLKVNTDK